MGGNASTQFADIVMDLILDWFLTAINFHIPFIKKYVDDLILPLPKDKVQTALELLNSYDKHLQFTVERENNNRIPYLDMLLHRNDDGTISTTWYSKPMASGRLVHYTSMHPLKMKLNVAQNLIKRVTGLTKPANREVSKETTTNILKKNGYPISLINRLINELSGNTQNPNSNTTVERTAYRSILHLPPLSNAITKLAKDINKDEKRAIQFGYRGPTKLKDLFHTKLKSKTPKNQLSNLIYSIPCKDCDKQYIGLTTQFVANRIAQHEYNSNRLSRLLENPEENASTIDKILGDSALCDHIKNNKHKFDFTKYKIVDKANDLRRLRVCEMLHILDNKTVNFRRDVEGISGYYSNLLNIVNKKYPAKKIKTNLPTQNEASNTTQNNTFHGSVAPTHGMLTRSKRALLSN